MLKKVKDLKQHAMEVERRVPLLSLQKNDEMLQLKYFIITYYLPILSVYELSTLKTSCGNLLDSVIDKAKQRQYQELMKRSSSQPTVMTPVQAARFHQLQAVNKLAAIKQPGKCTKSAFRKPKEGYRPKPFRCQSSKHLDNATRLSNWANREKQKYEKIDKNLQSLKHQTQKMENHIQNISTSLKNKRK